MPFKGYRFIKLPFETVEAQEIVGVFNSHCGSLFLLRSFLGSYIFLRISYLSVKSTPYQMTSSQPRELTHILIVTITYTILRLFTKAERSQIKK